MWHYASFMYKTNKRHILQESYSFRTNHSSKIWYEFRTRSSTFRLPHWQLWLWWRLYHKLTQYLFTVYWLAIIEKLKDMHLQWNIKTYLKASSCPPYIWSLTSCLYPVSHKVSLYLQLTFSIVFNVPPF